MMLEVKLLEAAEEAKATKIDNWSPVAWTKRD